MESKSTKRVPSKKVEVIDDFTYKFHANGKSIWSKGKVRNGNPDGYWEWYRLDGTLKRSGVFENGVPVGKWITYDTRGAVYKITER